MTPIVLVIAVDSRGVVSALAAAVVLGSAVYTAATWWRGSR